MSKEAIAKAPSGRPSRQPVGSRSRLSVAEKDPNYEYRWVVDYDGTGDRLTQFEQAGYEKVPTGTHRVGNSRVDIGAPDGSFETQKVGNNQTGYLMRQKREWYDEDQKAKRQRIDLSEQALKNPTLDGAYGEIKITKKDE
jgi:hypothetical protein